MLLPALLISVLSAAPVDTAAKPPVKSSGVDAIALPVLSFNSDFGIGYGAVGGMYLYGEGHTPYQHGLGAMVYFTNRGVQNHYLRYDGPGLLGPLRVEARFEYRREFRSPFYGAGNLSAPDFRGQEDDERYNYDRGSPGAWLRLRWHPLGEPHPLQTYVGYFWRHTNVEPYQPSVLAQLEPLGIEGGSTGQVLAGALWDTRDHETDPTTGGVEEVAFRLANPATGSDYPFVGVTLSERRYFRLSSRVVFAQRLSLDMLFGQVPFFEWSATGGVLYTEGVGGMSSVRGVERNRFAGNIKVFSNTELRVHALEKRILGQPMRLGATAFLDVGRVWHPGVKDGAWHQWHPGVGAGLRVSRRAAVIRVDWALSTETGGQRIYMNFGHMF